VERYEVSFRRSVLKDLDRIPKADVARIVALIRSLAADPRPRGSQRLAGEQRYRVRQGKYRILYSIPDAEGSVWIVKVAHRKDAYR
jgi:mRNA interferase RelE/StbE